MQQHATGSTKGRQLCSSTQQAARNRQRRRAFVRTGATTHDARTDKQIFVIFWRGTKGRQLCSSTQQAALREGSYAAARNRQHATGSTREGSYAAAVKWQLHRFIRDVSDRKVRIRIVDLNPCTAAGPNRPQQLSYGKTGQLLQELSHGKSRQLLQ
jgi:hypothetical protein